MCAIDSRAAEDHGLSLSIFDGDSDSRFPINVDDSELFPNMQELPVGKAQWTDMTFSLTMIEISRVLSQLHRGPDAYSPGSESRSPGNQKLMDLEARLEVAYLKHCDSNIPIQNATRLCIVLMIAKLKFLVSHQWLKRRSGEQRLAQADDETLLAACHILEINLQLQTGDLLRGFRWYFETYTQHHLLTYVLWHLCVKPVGLGIERAWSAIDASFAVADNRDIAYELGSRWKVLQLLKEKAMGIRQSCDMESKSVDSFLGEMNVPSEDFDGHPNLRFDDAFWDFTATDFDMQGFEGGYLPR